MDNHEYVVLGDNDTYDGIEGCHVYVITEKGSDQVDYMGGFKQLDDKFVVEKISIAFLLDFYNERKESCERS